ncbi:MAG: hypothetical protein QXH80_03555 [Candidatus Nanoarchaeia archaeon]
MADKKEKLEEKISFEDIGNKIEEAERHGEGIDHYIAHYYHEIVAKYDLHKIDYKFEAKHKDELIDSILGSLKNMLVDMGKIKKEAVKGIDETMWEEAILPSYFGISRTILKKLFAKAKRITPNTIHKIILGVKKQLTENLQNSALAGLGHEHIEPGKEYIAKLAKQYGFDFDKDKVKELKHLYAHLIHAHRYKRLKSLGEEIQELEE